MAKLLYRLGHSCVRRRRTVLAAWIILLVGVGIWSNAANGKTSEVLTIPGTESQSAADLLSERFPAQSGTTIRIALKAPDGHQLSEFGSEEELESALQQLFALPNVVPPADPLSSVTVSPDGEIAFIEVRFDKPAVELPKEEILTIIEATRDAAPAVVEVAFSGEAVAKAVAEPHPPSELIGFVVAIIVLLLAFGSVLAMGLPLLTALIGVGVAIISISVLSAFTDLSSVSPTLATMIGLAVGIDYALFIVTRHRAFHAAGLSPAESAARANATSGGAVVFAGGTVIIALAGLFVAGIPFLTAMGLCAAGAVAIAVLVAITLVPALLGFAGENIDRVTIPGIKVTTGEGVEVEKTFSGRMAKAITDKPWPYLLLGVLVMLVLSAPILAIRLGLPDDGSKAPGTTEREAYDILVDGFGAGFNGPLTFVVDLRDTADPVAALTAIGELALADPDVAVVTYPLVNADGDTAVLNVIPKSGPASSETEDLVHRLRDDLRSSSAVSDTGAVTYITGTTAANIDISEKLGKALPKYMALVIVLTMLLLLVVFRSILIPIKAAIAILLSIGGALGVTVAMFQWGWLANFIGVENTVPIVSFVPLMMFGILFGLSMDYEVFILSRIREEYAHTDDPHGAVLTGLASSARVITAAALIMISVFGAFVLGDDVVIKMFGIGLAVAVLLDATVVRMIIVPAVMTLFDRAAWWLPKWLRKLPDLDVEGAKLLQHLEGSGTH
ncbi:MAG: MMPL family transporter [Ilumatobacteraceae bacterium]